MRPDDVKPLTADEAQALLAGDEAAWEAFYKEARAWAAERTKCGRDVREHCMTPAHHGECLTHRPVGSGLRAQKRAVRS